MSKATAGKDTGHGYYMYADGTSYWGVGTYRNDECPILITAELHNAKADEVVKAEGMTDEAYTKAVADAQPLAKKMAFYKDTIAAAKDKQEKKDTEEKEEKKAKK